MSNEEVLQNLKLTLGVVAKENYHLQGVRRRLFPEDESIDIDWLTTILNSPEGEDRLESFGSKFARMQDTMIDKLLPRLLYAVAENPGSAIDNLNRAEKLGFVGDAAAWIAMRRLRNKLVHEYIETDEEMLPALKQAEKFSDELQAAFEKIQAYATEKLKISLN